VVIHPAFQVASEATPGGFEPPISTVTGWHVRPLHHGALRINEGYACSPIKKCIKDALICQVYGGCKHTRNNAGGIAPISWLARWCALTLLFS
jgi:hypothetical protein